MRSRLLRSVVALLLICCLIVNLSPIRANAVVGEAVLVSGMGIAATLICLSMGVVWLDLTMDKVNALGESLGNHLYLSALPDDVDYEHKCEIIDFWTGRVENGFGGSGEDPDDNGSGAVGGLLSIPEEIMKDVVEWVAGLIGGDTVEGPYETAPDGYAYFNGILLPKWKQSYESYKSKLISYDVTSGKYKLWCYEGEFVVETIESYGDRVISTGSGLGRVMSCGSDGTSWSSGSSFNGDGTGFYLSDTTYLVWTLNDLYWRNTGELFVSGMEPADSWAVLDTPDAFVGDIPLGVQDGTISTDDYVIDDIYYGDIIGNLDSAVDDLNLIGYDLADGVMEHDAYLEMTKSPLPKLAETPKITQDLSTNRVTYTIGDAPEPLTVVAESTDRGTLTYQWYQVKQGGLVHPRIEGATEATFYPPTTEAGSWRYYCRVTNTTEAGLTAFTSTKSAIVDVLDPSTAGPMGDTQSGTFINTLVDALLEGIKSLFVPDAEAMAAQKAKWDTLLADRFGALYEAGDAVSDLTGVFADQGVQKTILFPSVTIPLVDSNFTFGGWEVQVVPDGIDVLVEPLKLIIDIVCTLAALAALRRRFEKVLEGHGG